MESASPSRLLFAVTNAKTDVINFFLCWEGGILPSTNAAPALQAHAKELERHMLADNLEHKIQNRPNPDDLISQGILTEDEDPRAV